MLHSGGSVTGYSTVFGTPLPMPDNLGTVAAIAAGGSHSLLLYGETLRKWAHLTAPLVRPMDPLPRVTLNVPLGKAYALLFSRDLKTWSWHNAGELLEIGIGKPVDLRLVHTPPGPYFLKLVAP